MKNIFTPVLYIFLVTVTIETSYGQVPNDLQAADSSYLNKNQAVAKTKYLRYLGDTSKNSMI
jgi:hypothetical protein